MKIILQFMKRYRKSFIFAVLFMVLDVACEITQPVLMAKIVGEGIQSSNSKLIILIGSAMIALAGTAIFAGSKNAKHSAVAGVGFASELRSALFKKVQGFSFKNIDNLSTASLVTRLTNDVTLMQNTSIMAMRVLIRAPLLLTFALVMAISINARLALILAVAMPCLVIALALILRKAIPLFQKMQKTIDNLNQAIRENLTNVRVVKSFVRQNFEKEKFRNVNDDVMNVSLNAMNLVILNMPILIFILNASTIAVIYFGGMQVIDGFLDVATMSAFISYIFQILMSLMMLSFVFIMFSRASASYKRIVEVLDTKIDLNDRPKADNSHKFKGNVKFEHVYFKYDTSHEEYILKDINLSAKSGEVVAVIGGTGSGKTTLIQLIPRLYDASKGKILIDNKDVKSYTLNSLRNNVSVVLQKNTLFSGTIKENLKWGNPEATDNEIIEATKAAQAHDFIMGFPNQYDTWIEQGGVNVSGGQKQRLCIARAMLKKPAILILDDSTSAVDTATESKIRTSFNTTLKDTTTFIIAQRISSVKDADKIILLDDGKIVAEGTHDELLKSSEEYREIYYSQQEKEVKSNG